MKPQTKGVLEEVEGDMSVFDRGSKSNHLAGIYTPAGDRCGGKVSAAWKREQMAIS